MLDPRSNNSTQQGSGSNSDDWSLFPYNPSKVLPIVFGILVLISACVHSYQAFIRYKLHRFGFFMVWGSSVWVAGFVLREISAYFDQDVNVFIAQYVMILAGPPIYAAAEYFILGRLLYYVPYHAPLHPGRCTSTFILLGIAVENLSAAGASRLANSSMDSSGRRLGGNLLEASLILQACVEFLYLSVVATVYYRCRKSGHLPLHIRTICAVLFTTSALILTRCIFRVVEAFEAYSCDTFYCGAIAHNEWYLWVFEVAVMVIYIFMLNFLHPGRFLPSDNHQYLDPDGVTERIGPGWKDNRRFIMTVIDPFGFSLMFRQKNGETPFWEESNPIAEHPITGPRPNDAPKLTSSSDNSELQV